MDSLVQTTVVIMADALALSSFSFFSAVAETMAVSSAVTAVVTTVVAASGLSSFFSSSATALTMQTMAAAVDADANY